MKKATKEDLKLLKSLGTASIGEFLTENEKARTAVPQEDESDDNKRRNLNMLVQAENYWSTLSNFRRRRERAVNYYQGKQWCDKVEVYKNGRKVAMTEYEYLSKQGRPPLKQNMIRPALKNLLGYYRANPTKPLVFARNRDDQQASEMMSVALDAVLYANDSKDRDTRCLEEFLISGAVVERVGFQPDFEHQMAIPKFQSVNINRFFYNTDTEDIMGKDVDFIGELKDMTLDDVVSTYAKSAEDETKLRTIYKEINADNIRHNFGNYGLTAEKNIRNIDFYWNSSDRNKCRVIEIWRKESEWRLTCHDYLDGTLVIRKKTKETIKEIEEENKNRENLSKTHHIQYPPIRVREQYVQFWKCYHLSPTGDTIFECETPYAHKSHPYVFSFYPLVDGRAWGMVEDLIDQQKMINRNMILFDFINGASAKGVLLVPEESIADDFTLEDIAEEWTKFNGVIKIKAKAGAQIPHQIITSSVHPGLEEMIQMQLKFMQDIGGVQDASMGKNIGASTPASLYAQQTQNANLNNLDYVSTFNNFIQKRDLRLVQIIQQYYTQKQFINPSGTSFSKEAKYYDPEKVRNIEFECSIGSSNDTPAFRALVDNTLLQLLQMQQIDIDTYLENSSVPYADKILEGVRKYRQKMEEQQQQMQQQQMLMQQQAQEAQAQQQGAEMPAQENLNT